MCEGCQAIQLTAFEPRTHHSGTTGRLSTGRQPSHHLHFENTSRTITTKTAKALRKIIFSQLAESREAVAQFAANVFKNLPQHHSALEFIIPVIKQLRTIIGSTSMKHMQAFLQLP
ncbi:hypothetical protein WJX77_007298 [Trebouxia sp. C0004]